MAENGVIALGESSFILIKHQAQQSLLNLPQVILDDIILIIHETTNYDAYLCDLRLVSHRFNQSVLHCLAFRASPRNVHEEHRMSCPQHRVKCGLGDRCGKIPSCDATYARVVLQGNLATLRTQTPRLLRHYKTLNQALAILRTDMMLSASSYTVARSAMNKVGALYQKSQPLALAEPDTLVLCDAAVTLFRFTGRSWLSLASHSNEVTDRRSEFWLRLLACYLGDYGLLCQYLPETDTAPQYVQPTSTECKELLMMVALRGHDLLFEQIISHPDFRDTDLSFALCGACHSDSLSIANKILDTVPIVRTSILCAEGLSWLHVTPRFRAVRNRTIEQVVDRYNGTTNRDRLRDVVQILADIGAARSLQVLLARFKKFRLWSYPRGAPILCFSPLWHACVNGDMNCVLALLEGGYFKSPNSDTSQYLLSMCRETAALANNLPICKVLYRYQYGDEEFGLPVQLLAIVDGTIDLMEKKLAAEPDIIDEGVINPLHQKYTHWEVALKRAAERLRVENLAFLLGRGVRPRDVQRWSTFEIEWRYRRMHEEEYQAVQKLLSDYGAMPLKVSL